ncbi:hypothetical protein L3X38_033393 [Prunus dulcis]|uniref:Uncharacterized protein n=1 Tax=Prunus dulcis TaxID=3755 RepID=A0AAD4VFV1_PRUDU|nr:hypothetical protein L3X38_033393 [Prunus dulcis]
MRVPLLVLLVSRRLLNQLLKLMSVPRPYLRVLRNMLAQRNISTWVFKKPMRDITNSAGPRIVAKPDSGALIFRVFSWERWLIHDHKPPNIGQRVFNEAFSSSVGLTSDDMDHHGDFVDQGDAESGVGTAMVVEQVASTSGDAAKLGAGKESCARTIKDLKKAYAIDILAILEPRIGGARALQIAKNLGFSNYHIVDATGFSGGVVVME